MKGEGYEKMRDFLWSGEEDTAKFGRRLGELLFPGATVVLNGDLGAGKTTLSQSVGLGLGVEDYITSPTFALVNEYEGRLPMYHMDVYRIEAVDELDDLGLDDYFYSDGVSVVEWGERIERFLPEHRLELRIEKVSESERRVIVQAFGEEYLQLLEKL